MTLPEIKEDLLRKLFIERAASAPDYVVQDVLQAINGASQTLNGLGVPFWERSTVDKSFDETNNVRVFNARKVQSVRSKETGLALSQASSKQEVLNYDALFESARGNEVDGGFQKARIYFVESERPASKNQVRVLVGPGPLLDQVLELELIPVFTAYTTADLENSSKEVPIPFDHIETIFLPIARFFATRSHFYSDDNYQMLESDYVSAIDMVKRLNPGAVLPSVEDIRRRQFIRAREEAKS